MAADRNGDEHATERPILSEPRSGPDPDAQDAPQAEELDLSLTGEELEAQAQAKHKKGRRPFVGKPKVVNLEALAKKGITPGMPAPYDPKAEEQYPNLWQYLTMSVYSDGTARILPTVTINRQPGCYVVALQDHELMRQVRVESPDLAGVWTALELAIPNPHAWTAYNSRQNKKKAPFSLRVKKPGQQDVK